MPIPSKRPSRGSATFQVACGALLMIGLAQVGVGMLGGQARQAKVAEAPKPVAVPIQEPPPKSKPPVEIAPPVRPAPVAPLEPVVAVTSLDVPISDENVLTLLDQGLALRAQADLVGALEAFKAALKEMPDHPKLIYQMAYTYDLMGLDAKALPFWRTLQSLGKGAGDYQLLAEMRLRERAAPVGLEKEGRLVFADVGASKDASFQGGEKQVLRFSLQKRTAEQILPTDVTMTIHFFETVNGRKIARASVEPSADYLTLPVDWEDGPEVVEATYLQPDMSPEELRRDGKRAYYGYVLEVYWKDKLQDIVAEPQELVEFAREMPVGSPEIQAGGAGLAPQGADDVLFPK